MNDRGFLLVAIIVAVIVLSIQIHAAANGIVDKIESRCAPVEAER
jgi:hypothetical protein